MITFKLVLTCRNCDEDAFSDVVASTLISGGLPVIPADIADQMTFDCLDCRATNYTGELDVECEGGDDPDEDGDEDGQPAVSSVDPQPGGAS